MLWCLSVGVGFPLAINRGVRGENPPDRVGVRMSQLPHFSNLSIMPDGHATKRKAALHEPEGSSSVPPVKKGKKSALSDKEKTLPRKAFHSLPPNQACAKYCLGQKTRHPYASRVFGQQSNGDAYGGPSDPRRFGRMDVCVDPNSQGSSGVDSDGD